MTTQPARLSIRDLATVREVDIRTAIEMAAAEGLTIGKYADPTEGGRCPVMAGDAIDIAREDSSLIYVVAL